MVARIGPESLIICRMIFLLYLVLIVLYSGKLMNKHYLQFGINLASGHDDYIRNKVWAAPGLHYHSVDFADQCDPGLSVDGRDA